MSPFTLQVSSSNTPWEEPIELYIIYTKTCCYHPCAQRGEGSQWDPETGLMEGERGGFSPGTRREGVAAVGGTRIPISYPTPPPESPATASLGPNSAGASVEESSEWVIYVCAHGRLPTRVAQGKGWTGPL